MRQRSKNQGRGQNVARHFGGEVFVARQICPLSRDIFNQYINPLLSSFHLILSFPFLSLALFLSSLKRGSPAAFSNFSTFFIIFPIHRWILHSPIVLRVTRRRSLLPMPREFSDAALTNDDWADLDWYGEDEVDRGRAVVYRDVTRAAPVPDVPWLLMEPVSHEIRRRSLVCLPIVYLFVRFFMSFPAYI
ncbi:hypothetical protein LguiA_004434 [Lonicera macranthoides]